MAKRVVYAKGTHGFNDFVYVDLLPDVKRARQFNVNVIISLLLLVTATYVLVYIPYSTKLFEYEDLNGINQDLIHEYNLTLEEEIGYEIDLETISFEQDINILTNYKEDIKSIIDDVTIAIDNNDGIIQEISYLKETNTISVDVLMVVPTNYSILNSDFLRLNWVSSCRYTPYVPTSDASYYRSTYTIGVDADAK